MGRTLFTLALAIATVTLAVGLQDRSRGRADRLRADSAPAQLYRITLEGKFAGWAKPPKPAGSQLAPSQAKVLATTTAGKLGGDIAMEVTSGMSKEFYEWIQSSFKGKPIRKSGVVHACNAKYESMAVREFTNAMISEVTLPALDASSKEPAYMTIKLDAEKITYKKGDGKVVGGKTGAGTKQWQSSNFTVEIGDLPCGGVTKVDAITWKQRAIKVVREKTRTGKTQNLKLTLPMGDWDAWENWMTSSLLSHSGLKRGSITVMMSPDRQDCLKGFTVILDDISIVRMTVEAWAPDDASVQRFTVELHVNHITLKA